MPGSEMKLKKLQKLDWLVEARNEIQTFMLELYKIRNSKSDGRAHGNNQREEQWHLFIGATFSLWRAVFLAHQDDVPRKMKEINKHATGFLCKLIEDNQILYRDEKDWKSWTTGYYLNNAIERLRELVETMRLKNIKTTNYVSNEVLKDSWNKTFFGLQQAFKSFKSNS